MQEMFSRTFIRLADGREVVIHSQMRPWPRCPRCCGSQSRMLENMGVWTYSPERLPGKMRIHGVVGKGAEDRITSTNHFGDAASALDEVTTYRPLLREFLNRLNKIYKLPLCVSHYDLNEGNILIDESCEVTGLDRLSTPKPFAGIFWIPEEFEVVERALWNELFAGMPQRLVVCYGEISMKALPKYLTYRIPR
ncbi:hypothetical protein P885DRAFT_68972 [Corynascus similis CBS 632.67]